MEEKTLSADRPLTGTAETAPEKSRGEKAKKGTGRGRKKWMILAVVAVVLAAALIFGGKALSLGGQQDAGAVSYMEAAVETRDITNVLTGSGALQAADSYTVNTLVSGEITGDYLEEGDLVEKDQLLYTLDTSNAQNSVSQAQRNYQSAYKAKYPTATMSGTVQEVYVKNGDSVNNGTELLRIVADNSIYVDLLFTFVDNSTFYVGQPADLFVSGFAGTVSGTVAAVSTSSTASSTGRKLVTVRVKATNPGLITEDYTVTAAVGGYSSYGSAPISLGETATITASGSGTVSGLDYLAGDLIGEGDLICTLTGDSVDNALTSARESLSNAQDTLDDYSITAPISGTVITKSAKAGDKIEGGGNTSLCVIYDLSYLEMTLNIDELDISQVAVGQQVSITADAVEGRTYTGAVTKVSVAGTTSGGTTTYPVTVRIDETEGLLPGMNVDAEIVVESAAGALAVPSGAVNRGGTVLVTAASPSAVNATAQEAPEGYAYVEVTTGVSDDSYTQILSGLQAGDTVAYIPTTSGSGDMTFVMEAGAMPGGMVTVSGGGPGGMGGGHGGGF